MIILGLFVFFFFLFSACLSKYIGQDELPALNQSVRSEKPLAEAEALAEMAEKQWAEVEKAQTVEGNTVVAEVKEKVQAVAEEKVNTDNSSQGQYGCLHKCTVA